MPKLGPSKARIIFINKIYTVNLKTKEDVHVLSGLNKDDTLLEFNIKICCMQKDFHEVYNLSISILCT